MGQPSWRPSWSGKRRPSRSPRAFRKPRRRSAVQDRTADVAGLAVDLGQRQLDVVAALVWQNNQATNPGRPRSARVIFTGVADPAHRRCGKAPYPIQEACWLAVVRSFVREQHNRFKHLISFGFIGGRGGTFAVKTETSTKSMICSEIWPPNVAGNCSS